jgi:hypothetical protein
VVTLRRALASLVAWTLGAVAAVGVGMLALSLIGEGLSSRTGQPLTPDAVAREASTAPSATVLLPEETPSAAPAVTAAAPSTPTKHPDDRLVSARGGSAIVRCTPAGAYLVSWSPDPGYRFDSVNRGPAAHASVRFRAGEDHTTLWVTCVGDVPQVHVSHDDDDDHGATPSPGHQ